MKFVPGKGAEVIMLDNIGVEDVRNGEDRVGFLPRSYWGVVTGPRAGNNGNTTETKGDV